MGLTDTDKMPFGKYAGQSMGSLDRRYLIWLSNMIRHTAPNKRQFNQKLVFDYTETKFKENNNEQPEE